MRKSVCIPGKVHHTSLFKMRNMLQNPSENIEIQLAFLGTGTCNSSTSNPCSSALASGGDVLLIDAGGGFYHQMSRLDSPIFNYRNISTILITHFHIDHISGLPDLFWGEMWDITGRRSDPLTFVGPHGLVNFYENRLLPFLGDYPVPFEVRLVELDDGQSYKGPFYTATARSLEHGVFSTGYIIEVGNHRIAYTGDTGYCEALIDLISHSNTAVIEWSIPEMSSFPGHLSTGDFAKLINLGLLPDVVYINHMYLPSGESFDQRVKKFRDMFPGYSERIFFPQDLDIFRIG